MSNSIHPKDPQEGIDWCEHITLKVLKYSCDSTSYHFTMGTSLHVPKSWELCPVCCAARKFTYNKRGKIWKERSGGSNE